VKNKKKTFTIKEPAVPGIEKNIHNQRTGSSGYLKKTSTIKEPAVPGI
jgi:hypothetical protein